MSYLNDPKYAAEQQNEALVPYFGPWKIIWCDGYNRDYISESLVAENIPNEGWGKKMLQALTDSCSESDWFRLERQDYSLFVWEP